MDTSPAVAVHLYTEPENVKGASRQQKIQPFAGVVLLHQAHHAVRQKVYPSNGAATELENSNEDVQHICYCRDQCRYSGFGFLLVICIFGLDCYHEKQKQH